MLSFNEASPDRYAILKEFAKRNRKNMTLAESVLWDCLRCNSTEHKFLRQYIIGDYIVDFISRDDGLVIEVDGAYHSEPRQIEDDRIRQEWIESKGYHFLRFTNEEVLYDTEYVLNTIDNYFNK